MTNRDRENKTLNFEKSEERGSVEETFYPWNLTVERFAEDGLPREVTEWFYNPECKEVGEDEIKWESYMGVDWGMPSFKYEEYFGFDPVKRVHFSIPFTRFGETIENAEDWERMKEHSDRELARYCTEKAMEEKYGPLRAGHEKGDYSIRLNISGFFWIPRDLFGIENHLYAFYDYPEVLHDICEYCLQIYSTTLIKIIDILQPDVVYISEDLSGKNGPMISGDAFDEFVGHYYRKLIPLMKAHGAGNIFVDTDGDFAQIIPNFIAAGVEGFLPMDVNAGMDIVKVRKDFPRLKFIGGYNKLCIAEGKEAIEREFDRILPVIRSGGYIPGADHQVAPSTSLENYRYYIECLREAMKHAGEDIIKE